MQNVNLKSVESAIKQDIERGFASIGLNVLHKGEHIYSNYFGDALKYDVNAKLLSLDKRVPLNQEMIFDLASVTKIFATTLAIMTLYEQGKVDINAKITTYIPYFTFVGTDYKPTIRDLLSHSTGLAPEIHFYNNHTAGALYSQDRERTKEILLTKLPLQEKQREFCIYSDNNMMILGLVIEAITGQRQDVYLEENIYKPMGLKKTCFLPLEKGFLKDEIVATQVDGHRDMQRREFNNIKGYTLRGEVHDEKALYSMGGVAGHAGLFSTPVEIIKLASLLWSDNQFFSQKTLKIFTTPSTINPSYSLGFRLVSGEQEMRNNYGDTCSDNSFGHLGFTGICILLDPATKITIIFTGNCVHSKIIYPRVFEGKLFRCGKYSELINLVYRELNLINGTSKNIEAHN